MKKLILCFVVLVLSACAQEKRTKDAPLYFDLQAYFKNEAARLKALNPSVDKTVIINNRPESRKLTIKDWVQELSSFIDADINKASWRGSFKIITNGQVQTYLSDSKKIPVKKVELTRVNGNVKGLKIFITNKNDLYLSADSLTYYPDSLYEIKKTQQIKLMDGKRYVVRGRF